MVKVVSGIAAFVLTFGFSVSLVGLLFGFTQFAGPSYETRDASGIANFLKLDVENGESRDRKIRRELYHRGGFSGEGVDGLLPFYSRSVSEYVAESSALDDSNLPADLRYAWRDHMEAWKKHDDLLRFAAKGGLEESTFRSTYKRTSNEIKETWYQVLRIAERYGVETSRMR